MNLFNQARQRTVVGKQWFFSLSLLKKIVVIGIVAALLIFGGTRIFGQKSSQPQYETAQATRGTLVSSVTASGTISSANSASITTSATGTVKQVFVKNGDTVTQGQQIAEINPDQSSQQKQAAAWATYLSAINSQNQAQQNKLSADAQMWTAQQAVITSQDDINNLSTNSTNPQTQNAYTDLEKQNINSSLVQSRKAFDAAELSYKQADASINASAAQVTSTWLAYQQTSNIITAPSDGKITNLTLTPGSVISGSTSSSSTSTSTSNSSSSTSSNSSSSTSYGSITMEQGQLQATVNLSEIDVTSVKPGQKVTMTLDAFPDKTFTGEIATIDTNGSVSSGVTTYPATITFDDTSINNIYPNMAVSAKIITDVTTDAIVVPSAAVQTSNGSSTVQVQKNGKVSTVNIEVGKSNDTQVVITSGINEGDTVVTGSTATTTGSTSGSRGTTSASPFGGTGFGGGGGNAVIRRQ